MPFSKVNLTLDSGAFSVWKQGGEIPIEDYFTFLCETGGLITSAINLDVIPGSPAGAPSAAEIEMGAAKGYENLVALRSCGFDTLPVFHAGERLYWLEKLIDDGYTYIGISPSTIKSSLGRQQWLDKVFTYLTNDEGAPLIDTHGFGLTSIPLIQRYPWRSVDSTTWMLRGAFGQVLIPKRKKDGSYDYMRPPKSVFITDNAVSKNRSTHFNAMPVGYKDHVVQFLDEQGLTLEACQAHHGPRFENAIRLFQHIEEAHVGKLFKHRTTGFFSKTLKGLETASPKYDNPFTLIYASLVNKHFAHLLTKNGVENRLLSYVFANKLSNEQLSSFIETGLFD